jgi:DNA repair protein RecN (Recombination protein N)
VLRALEIRDFVIVERASLELERGFSVLTGETGAGKSILVDAIELLVGARADAGVVREGAERAELSAEFEVDLAAWLEARELAGDPGRILLRRVIDRSGRSRSFINGHSATLTQLKEVGELLVDIHGQHAHQSLLRSASQRELLDAHADAAALARDTAAAFREWKRLEEVALEAESSFAARESERADLAEKVAELERLGLREGEWDLVTAEHARLSHGSALLAGAQSSLEALTESEGAALAQLAAVAARLRSLSAHDARLGAVLELLDSAEAQASEAVRELRHYASRVDLDPEALRDTESRMQALHAAARKHRVKPEALAQRLAELKTRLAELELAVDPEALKREVAAAQARYRHVAKRLSVARGEAAARLSKSVTAAMQGLAMAGGRFSATLAQREEPAASGLEDIEFEVASHPSLPLRPLAKVASGGELSRVSLAIQMVAAKDSPVATLVFDEVDSGIGGTVADTIGRSLRRLGKERQVLCVTHLPQVAACAHGHHSVDKLSAKGRVSVRVARLDRAARVAELARMLGGAETTARKHAAELLDAD